MDRILIIGDRNCVPACSVGTAEEAFPGIFGCGCDVMDETAYGSVTCEELENYGIVVFMPSCWARTGTEDAAAAIFTYVLRGGKLFVLGNGLDVGKTQEIRVLLASVYKEKGYYTEIDLTGTESFQADGTGTVTLRTQPHFVRPDAFRKTDVLMTFRYGNAVYPGLWTHPWGKGRVACLAADLTEENAAALAPVIRAAGRRLLA